MRCSYTGNCRRIIRNGFVTAVANSAAKSARVGTIMAIAVAWGLAFTEIAMSGASFASGQLLNIIALAVAQTIVALIMLAIALIPVVGQIIAAVIALVDAVIALACYAAGKNFAEKNEFGKRFCKGLSGLTAELIKTFLYSRRSLVGNLKSDERLGFYDFALTWVNPDLGMVKDAAVTLNMGITNTIILNGFVKDKDEYKDDIIPMPVDPLSLPFFWQLNNTNLKSATFDYNLQAGPDDSRHPRSDLERNTMNQNGKRWQTKITRFLSRRTPSSPPIKLRPKRASTSRSICIWPKVRPPRPSSVSACRSRCCRPS